MPRINTNILRRFRKINRFLQTGSFVIRLYFYYFIRGYLCVLNPESAHYKRYFRVNR
jgi:hypothetical protein